MNNFEAELFQGLKELAESAFPKKCSTCGRTFDTAAQFLFETQSISESSAGLKESSDDDGATVVEVFRNCPCGSTLLDFFTDRRDVSEAGLKRRKRFGELLLFLMEHGVEHDTARTELLKVLRGGTSEVLAKIRPPARDK
ncbi:MAG: oxidoreductase [Nitrospira sp.]|nr:oxidoreductase [Nitrospira sp.]